MGATIDARAYGPDDVTPELRQAFKERIYIHSGRVIMWRELPIMTVTSADIFSANFAELTKDLDWYAVIVDLTGTALPSAAARARYASFFRGELERGRFRAAAMVTGRNFVINAAARFVATAIGVRTFSVHKEVGDAIAALEEMTASPPGS